MIFRSCGIIFSIRFWSKLRAYLLFALFLCIGWSCEYRPATRPDIFREPTNSTELLPSDGMDAGNRVILPRFQLSTDGSVTTDASVIDLGLSQCPGVHLYCERCRPTPPLTFGYGPTGRVWGQDEAGNIWPLRNVLQCELHMMHFFVKPHDEGHWLTLWRGPAIFAPDRSCEWREPWRSEIIRGSPTVRRIHFRERCRRANQAGSTDRPAWVDVTSDYQITAHIPPALPGTIP